MLLDLKIVVGVLLVWRTQHHGILFYSTGNEGYGGGGGGFGQDYQSSYGGGPMKSSSYGNQRSQPYGGGGGGAGGEDNYYSKFPPVFFFSIFNCCCLHVFMLLLVSKLNFMTYSAKSLLSIFLEDKCYIRYYILKLVTVFRMVVCTFVWCCVNIVMTVSFRWIWW